jgi:NADH dehydrogenase
MKPVRETKQLGKDVQNHPAVAPANTMMFPLVQADAARPLNAENISQELEGDGPSKHPKVVIIGGGFAGRYAAKTLGKTPVDVLMIDPETYHPFQMLLYQVATGALVPEDTVYPLRRMFRRQKNFSFLQATVTGVDVKAKTVLLQDGSSVVFDYLVVAAGAVTHDFATSGVKEYTVRLNSVEDAVALRNHIVRNLEQANADPSLIEAGYLNFVVVGGGPTGVEMAGGIREFTRELAKDYPTLAGKVRVIMLERNDRLLTSYRQCSSDFTKRVLESWGVDIRLNTSVKAIRAHEVELHTGETIPTQSVLWAAGFRAAPIAETIGAELTKNFHVTVRPDLSLPGHPKVFVAGDISGAVNEHCDLELQVAQVAIQQGKHVAKQIRKRLKGLPTEPFRYRDPGSMAIIGRHAAVAEFPKTVLNLRLRGWTAWLLWLGVHLLYLPGIQNRVHVLLDWINNYVTRNRRIPFGLELPPRPQQQNVVLRAFNDMTNDKRHDLPFIALTEQRHFRPSEMKEQVQT